MIPCGVISVILYPKGWTEDQAYDSEVRAFM
jgi:hypothetical protein